MTACKHQGACVSSKRYTHCLYTLRETGLRSKARSQPVLNWSPSARVRHCSRRVTTAWEQSGYCQLWAMVCVSTCSKKIHLDNISFRSGALFLVINSSRKWTGTQIESLKFKYNALLLLHTHKLFPHPFPFSQDQSFLSYPVSTQGTIQFKWGRTVNFWQSSGWQWSPGA